MSSFVKSAEPRQPHPFAADGGAGATPSQQSRNPFEILDDLMVVIEALCPTWPQRAPFIAAGQWRM